ncbi:MAG: DUF1367 family protein [Candidatus Sabulitectum sp.]|nr:DUF1367 family protein [Candidatus Sabulitectum sp.]
MEIALIKTASGWLGFDPTTTEWLSKKKVSSVIRADFKQARNPAFHRKGMSLLSLAYEYWEPGELDNQYGTVLKNFDRFRKDLTILAGHYEQYHRLDGSVRVEAKSLSFGSMDEEEFSKVYQSLLTVILDHIFKAYSPEDVEKMAEQFWSYA